MKKFLFRLFLFLVPFLAALWLELFILPIDFFTFRVWEAAVVKEYRRLLPGPFYPNLEITKLEDRDLAHHTEFAEKRKVTWMLDPFGYRKQETGRRYHPIVVVGDSNVAGSGLTQEEMFSEVLEKKLQVSTYPFSPGSINGFLSDKRFLRAPPKIVILGSIEREITNLRPPRKLKKSSSRLQDWLRTWIVENRSVQSLGILLDRFYKMNMLYYWRASLRRLIRPRRTRFETVPSPDGPVFFLQGARANEVVPKDQFQKAVLTIKGYREVLASRGIRFIFLPIPNKETIYYEALRSKRPAFLTELMAELKKMGIEAVDTQTAFEEAFLKKSIPYRAGDTHWNENGVRLAADLVKRLIDEGRLIKEDILVKKKDPADIVEERER